MTFPDEQILQRVKNGDEIAFAQIYRHFYSPALKFCTSLLKDRDEAENVTQDVFAKIWDRRQQIKPEYSFQAYLFVSLRNQVFDQFKKYDKDKLLRQQYIDRSLIYADEEVDDREGYLQFLRTAVNALSDKRKKILILNIDEGKSYKEIALLLNISTNTVKNQLIKAKQILRQKVSVAHA